MERRLGDWLEANFIGMSYPDPRIWCNFIGAMGGSTRTTVAAATVAGVLGSDSRAYGGSQTAVHGMRFIQAALRDYNRGADISDIIGRQPHRNGRPVITGFARPVDAVDERIEPMRRITLELGFETGPHLRLANEIDYYLEQRFGQGMNIGGYKSAFLSDQGYTPDEVYAIKACVVASGVTACYLETRGLAADTFLPLRCDDIDYTGAAPRSLPNRE